MTDTKLLLREVISDTWKDPSAGHSKQLMQKERYERIRRITSKYKPREIFALGTKLMEMKEYQAVADPSPVPKTYRDINIGRARLYQGPTALHELAWLCASISRHSSTINTFWPVRDAITKCMLSSEYTKAKQLANDFERASGVSRWLTQVKFYLLDCTNEFSEQKRISTSIMSDGGIAGELRCAIHFLSWKTEKNVSHHRFTVLMNDSIAKNKLGEFAQQYYGFLCNFDVSTTYSELAGILNAENGSSIVDKYESLIKGICAFCRDGINTTDKATLCDLLGQVMAKVNDPQLAAIYWTLRDKIEKSKTQQLMIECLDEYTIGNYEACVDKSASLLNIDGPSLCAYLLVARALVASGNAESLIHRLAERSKLVNDISAIIAHRPGSTQIVVDLKKQSACSPDIAWAIQVLSFLEAECGCWDKVERGRLAMESFCVSRLKSPLGIAKATGAESQVFDDLVSWMPKSASVQVIGFGWDRKGFDRPNASIAPEFRIKKYEAIRYMKRGKCDDVERITATIVGMEGVYQHEIVRIRIEALLGSGRLLDAAELVVHAAVKHPDMRDALPVLSIWNAISGMRKAVRPCGIWYPILASLCDGLLGRKKYDITAEALDDYLRHMRLDSVSEIYDRRDTLGLDRNTLSYFFKNVCTWRSLEYCVMKPSQVDVEQERIRVCMILCEVDSENENQYKEEMLAIDRKIGVIRGDQELNKSRIYVNTAGIRSSVLLIHSDMMRRYVQYRGSKEDEEVMYVIPQKAIKGSASDITISSNERITILDDLFLIIRDAFASSPAYGLDGYLSVRVRHGELANHVLSSFDAEQLVVKAGSDGQRVLGQKWTGLGIDTRLHEILFEFTDGIAAIIEDVRSNIVQIRTERVKSSGLFDYSISQDAIRSYHKEFKDTISSEGDLIDAIMAKLWDRTNQIAEAVRSELSVKLRDAILELIIRFEQKISKSSSLLGASELQRAMAIAKSRFAEEAKLIIGWFNRYEPQAKEEWSIDTIFGLAESGGRQHHPRKRLDVEKALECHREFDSSVAITLMTIIQILLENIYDHAIKDGGNARVVFKVFELDDLVSIDCRSTLPEDLDIDAANHKLKGILERMRSESYLSAASGEKNSGLFKIIKAVKYDLLCSNQEFNANIDSARMFCVALRFRVRGNI